MAAGSFEVTCLCGASFSVTVTLVFDYRKDVDDTIALLAGTLNVATCPIDRQPLLVSYPLVVVDRTERVIAIDAAAFPDTLAEVRENSANFALVECTDRADLHRTVGAWAKRDFDAGRRGPADTEMTPRSLLRATPKLYLRLLSAATTGELPMNDAADAHLAEYNAALVEHVLLAVLEINTKDETFDALIDSIAAAVPRQCLTPDVLGRLAKRCTIDRLGDDLLISAKFAPAFRLEYLFAAVCFLADQQNPRATVWSEFLIVIWMMHESDRFSLDPRFLLTPEVHRRITSFRALWDQMAHRLNERESDEQFAGNIKSAGQMFVAYGFEAEFAAALPLAQHINLDAASPEMRSALLTSMQSKILEYAPFCMTFEQSTNLAELTGAMMEKLASNGYPDEAERFFSRMLDAATTAKDVPARIWIAAIGSKVLNAHGRFERAAEELFLIAPMVEATTDLPARLLRAYWTEVGNAHRYRSESRLALRVYERVEKLFGEDEKTALDLKDRRTLQMNQAIVLREEGAFRAAIDILLGVVTADPDNLEARHSLAVTYHRINDDARALEQLDKIIAAASGTLNAATRATFAISRVAVRTAAGAIADAWADVHDAFDSIPASATYLRIRIAAAAMGLPTIDEPSRARLVELETLLGDIVESSSPIARTMLLTAAATLGERLLEDGNLASAARIVGTALARLGRNTQYPWEVEFLRSRIALGQGDGEQAWQLATSAAAVVDAQVPAGSDVSLAAQWMRNKERFQLYYSALTRQNVQRRYVPAEELLFAYELANGREIRARIAAAAPATSTEAMLEAVRSLPDGVDVVAFIDGDQSIGIAVISGLSKTVRLLDASIPNGKVTELRRRVRDAYRRANPVALRHLDRALEEWRAFSAWLGNELASHVRESERVCVLPGRSLTGLPLHLLPIDGQPLIRRCEVTYAPNFTVLTSHFERQPADKLLLVAVTKESDREAFLIRAGETLDALAARARQTGIPVTVLADTAADRATLLHEIERASETVLLCHGCDAGPILGIGVCVSDGTRLPPPYIPNDKLEYLGRFVVSWMDFADVARTSATVVSIGCSTGFTLVTAGGVRYGFEQALFARGTRHILSPLWNVDQPTAVAWLDGYYRARKAGLPISSAHRQSVLCLADAGYHEFFWGPYIINGSALEA